MTRYNQAQYSKVHGALERSLESCVGIHTTKALLYHLEHEYGMNLDDPNLSVDKLSLVLIDILGPASIGVTRSMLNELLTHE